MLNLLKLTYSRVFMWLFFKKPKKLCTLCILFILEWDEKLLNINYQIFTYPVHYDTDKVQSQLSTYYLLIVHNTKNAANMSLLDPWRQL